MADEERTEEMETRIEEWLGDERTRTALLLQLAPVVPRRLLQDFVRFASEIEDPLPRFLVLQALSERASGSVQDEVREQAIRAARAIPNPEQRTAALLEVDDWRFSFGAVLDAIDASRLIADPLSRTGAFHRVAQRLLRNPEWLRGADALRTFQVLTRQLEPPRVGEPGSLLASRSLARITADFLSQIAGRLTGEEQREALRIARTINDESARATTLAALAPSLSTGLRPEAVMAVREIVGNEARARALLGYVSELQDMPELHRSISREALDLTPSIRHWRSQAAAFRRLNLTMPDLVVEEALPAELALRSTGVKSRALASLTPRLSLTELDRVAGAAEELPVSWGKTHLLESILGRAGAFSDPRARRLAQEVERQLQKTRWTPLGGYAGFGPSSSVHLGWTTAPYDPGMLRTASVGLPDAEIASFVRQNPEELADILVRRLREEPAALPSSFTRESADDRRVDVAMEWAVAPDVFDPIDPTHALRPGEAYRLRVHVGTPRPASLVVGEVPPIDALLPPPDDERGHELDVVVFPKSFQLRSAAVQPLWLPLRGDSSPVFFALRAPEKPGSAELRIAVYHRGHMVQSFLLTAPVGKSLPRQGDRVQVRLDFAATEQWAGDQIELLGERALSIGVNQDGGGGSHTFMVKRGGKAEGFTLDQMLVSRQVREFRKLLEDATFVPPIVPGKETPRFSTYPEAGAESNPVFHDYVRRLADFGRSLYDLLQGKLSDAVHDEVRALAGESDKVIQVVRHDANMAFPWGIIYDYPLEPRVYGAPPRPVCLGKKLPELGPAPASNRLSGCPHNPGHDVYCIEGFWGVRHRIEQRIGKTASVETVVRRSMDGPGVMLAASIGDENAADLSTQLRDALGGGLVLLRKEDDLLDLLWDPARRPAVLVILGHLETRDTSGEPVGPRIVLLPKSTWPPPGTVPKEHWLMSLSVAGMVQARGRWKDDPRTLVLLMACSSAATEVGTLNDLVTTLTPVGVGAVVGTETPVFTRLAARFASEVTVALWRDSGRTLGEAVQGFNRGLIRSGNPLAFAFTCIGNADLTLSS